MGVGLDGFHYLIRVYGREREARHQAVSRSGQVLRTEINGVHSQLMSQFIHHLFHCKQGLWRAGRPVGTHGGFIDDYIETVDMEIGYVVT